MSVTHGEVREWHAVEGMRPALLMTEAMNAIFTTKEHPEYIAALARARHHRPRRRADRPVAGRCRSATTPRPAGASRAASRSCATTPTDNGYARPIEGLIVHFDIGRNEVIEVIDHGVDAAAAEPRALLRRGPVEPLRTDLKPIDDHPARRPELHRRRQPGAVAEVVVPHRRSIRTRAWCCTRSPTTTTDGARLDPAPRVDHARWSCPYGDPGELHGWKNAFDAGEWGLGRMTQSLTLGCDCLGEIHYFDATLANEQGEP